MEKAICLVSLILVSGFMGVSGLQCYVCTDCPKPTSDNLKTCEPITTAAPPVTDPITTENPAGNTTTDPNTTDDPTGNTTTNVNNTEDPADNTTTALPPPNNGNEEEDESQSGRSKRSVLSTGNSIIHGCHCENQDDNCDCDENLISNRVSSYADDYVCLKATIKINNTDIIVRDCTTSVFQGQAACDYINATFSSSACETCKTDKCNSSYTLQYSLIVLAASLCVALFK